MIKLDQLKKIHMLGFRIKIFLISLEMEVLVVGEEEMLIWIKKIWNLSFRIFLEVGEVGKEGKEVMEDSNKKDQKILLWELS